MECKPRKEMDPRYLWNLSDIFPDKAAWDAAFASVQADIPSVVAWKGRLGESAASLKDALDALFALEERLSRVYVYAMLNKSGDNGDTQAQAMEDRATNLSMQFAAAASFITPEILSIPKEQLDAFRKDALLSGYAHLLDDVERGRAHTLDEQRETMLALLSDAASTPDNAFTMLESVDMTFPKMLDENGKEITITHGTFGVLRESRDARVRREAFEKYFGEFNRYVNTFAAMYGGSVKFDTFYATVRDYPSACEQALFSNNVPVSVYDNLVSAIHDNLGSMEKYLSLRKKALGIEELHMYDLYAPMVADVEYHIPYAQARSIVMDALAPLGADYKKLLEKAFSEDWIDVYENAGKTTGAFSCGVYGVHPYVLLNYTDTLEDVFTVAHELGHAMHSYKSAENNNYANHDYRIMVAEVASTVNEVLLLKHLLSKETDPARRAYLLNRYLENFRTTVFRQTLFAEFERRAHDMQQAGEPLTAQALSALYKELNELYYKGAVTDALQEIEWARIPHFYRSFYVYQYATGFCSAVSIASHILETGDASAYLRFLTTGGSDYPLEELKIAGVDLTKPEVVDNAMRVFDSTIDELSQLLIK
ncbi:MAG: oligoendopeptidase F [Eubacteriales bacterium]|nr:oligoendopeptidase F [Eubacteriales bacterium]